MVGLLREMRMVFAVGRGRDGSGSAGAGEAQKPVYSWGIPGGSRELSMDPVQRSTNPFTGRRLRRLLALATAGYAVALVVATHYPRPQEILLRIGAGGVADKTQHVVAYTVLGLLAAATLASWNRLTFGNLVVLLGALALFGVFDEVTQPVFGRMADPADWVADCVGIVAGVLVAAVGVAVFGSRQPAAR
jgi:VanZ family protein